uniref:GPI inositol-deacylase n=1 Tax=Fibrocapsa japonica TaxID=94617 RepID=A0A7S2UYV4_9STRA|mmetsp:Transcript_17071/g.24951  ORF Transcript_17071/g.24951 Transcript_17071/m.24951 type:complete len:322 (+) Transcript_17071:32-997(+)
MAQSKGHILPIVVTILLQLCSYGMAFTHNGVMHTWPANTARNKITKAEAYSLEKQEAGMSSAVKLAKKPILIFPAQFSVPNDYLPMCQDLERRGHRAYVAELSRADWLRIVPATLTADYWRGTLKPKECLGFFFEGVEKALRKVQEENPGSQIHAVGHSIGGWIARAYLGEVCDEATCNQFCSLTTLGTPHQGPPADSPMASFEQTRGLLSYVNTNFPGAYHGHMKYTCVCGSAQQGAIGANVEEVLAYASYLPLCGKGEAHGDGIVPLQAAFLDDAERIIIPEAKHSGFLPTPGNSISLPENFKWYGSEDLISKWAEKLD